MCLWNVGENPPRHKVNMQTMQFVSWLGFKLVILVLQGKSTNHCPSNLLKKSVSNSDVCG